MKKKKIIIGSLIIVILVIIVLIKVNRVTYTIKVSIIDDHSPDRKLEVYNDKGEKVDVYQIRYLDGTILCNGYNLTVYYGDIENEKKYKVILKDRTEVDAKIAALEVN